MSRDVSQSVVRRDTRRAREYLEQAGKELGIGEPTMPARVRAGIISVFEGELGDGMHAYTVNLLGGAVMNPTGERLTGCVSIGGELDVGTRINVQEGVRGERPLLIGTGQGAGAGGGDDPNWDFNAWLNNPAAV